MNTVPKYGSAGKSGPVWTTEEIARLLRVTPSHIRRLAGDGSIPCLTVGKRHRFDARLVLRRVSGDGVTEADIDRVLADCAGEVKP
jgi:excisionase family DNA binding protein